MSFTRRQWLQAGMSVLAAGAAHPLLARALEGGKPPRPLRILILGGTGFTGPHQVRYALARGHRITLFNRGRHPQEWPGTVEELTGDRERGDLSALDGREWDVCIDNPTSLPSWVRDAGRVLHDRVGQYVFISTISVYADNGTPGADENAALAAYPGKDAYAETLASMKSDMALYGPLKAQSEREAARQFGDRTTIIRPGLIVGPGDPTDRFTYWPVRIARGGEVLAPGDGKDPVQFIDARDLAEWTIRVAEQRAFGTFNATGPGHSLTMAAMLDGIRDSIRSSARFTWVPAGFLEARQVSPWSDLPVWIPRAGDGAGFATRSNRRAIAAGLSFRPLATTAADTLAWFRAQPADRQATLKSGLPPEREAEVLAEWHKP